MWSGAAFNPEIGTTKGFAGGGWSADFSVPAAAMAQLVARNASYPIRYDLSLDGNDDANVPWLARPSLIPSLCTYFTRAGIEWRR